MRTVGTLATSSWIAERLQGRAQFVVPSRHERTHHEKQAGIEPLQPLTSGRDVFKAGSIAWRHVQDIDQLDAALADAGGQAVLLDFYADWCVSCTEMDRFTFTDPRVSARCEVPIGCFCSLGLSLGDWRLRSLPKLPGAQPNEHP